MSTSFEVLESDEVGRIRKGSVSASHFVAQLQALTPGQGGRIRIEEGGPGRQTLKNQLKAASEMAGVPIQFIRSAENIVVFEVFPSGTVFPKRKGGPGRPRKSPAA